MYDNFFSLLGSIVLLLLILLSAYGASRFISTHFAKRSKSRHMEVLDWLSVGKDRWFILLKAGSKVFVVGVTPQGFQHISEISPDELGPSEAPEVSSGSGFDVFLKASLGKIANARFHTERDHEDKRE